MHPDLERLARLSDADMALWKAQDALAAAKGAVAAARRTVAEAEAARDAVRAEEQQIKDRERATHRELEQYRRRLDRAIKALETAMGDPAAAERQRVQCLEIIDRLETDMLEIFEELEEIEPRVKAAQTVVAEAEAVLERTRAEAPDRIGAAQTQVDELQATRDAEYGPLPRELKGRYDLLLGRKPPPVSRIVQGACRKCHHSVPQQALIDIATNDKILQCRGCGRWIVQG